LAVTARQTASNGMDARSNGAQGPRSHERGYAADLLNSWSPRKSSLRRSRRALAPL